MIFQKVSRICAGVPSWSQCACVSDSNCLIGCSPIMRPYPLQRCDRIDQFFRQKDCSAWSIHDLNVDGTGVVQESDQIRKSDCLTFFRAWRESRYSFRYEIACLLL